MTTEELVVAIRVTAEEAQDTLDALLDGFSRLGVRGASSMEALKAQILAYTATQRDAYRAAIEQIEHLRHIRAISAQEEYALLAWVKEAYSKNASQMMDMEERLYDAKQALMETQTEKITSLHEAVTDALKAQYAQQREIEAGRIDESVSQWKAWSEETCGAIQKQIDALDEQAQAEDRAAREAEYLRKSGSLTQALVYENDAYNQAQLRNQLEKLEAEWADVKKGWAQQDERDRLGAQMQDVYAQAQAEIDRLDAARKQMDAHYDALMAEDSLAAQAQSRLLGGNQEELMRLIAQYAPGYEAAGKTLGEKLYAGFYAAFGDVTAWFAQFDAQVEQLASARMQTLIPAQDGAFVQAAGAGATIHQTVNFNQPVESAADVTRRMQRVSEGLAQLL